jgi:hypothetical protein
MVVVSSAEVGRTWFSGRETEGLAASWMRTTGALSTGADEHPASTTHALNAAIVDRLERIGYLLLGLVGGRGIGRQGGDERLLRHLDPTDGLHPLLALLLLLQQLALARDVTAVTLR